MVCDQERVRAEGRRIVGSVLEPAEQTFVGQNAAQEGQIGLFELNREGALRIGVTVGKRPLPLRIERALPLPITQQLINDVDDRFVLEDVAVLPVTQQGKPGLDRQVITGEAAVAKRYRE